MSRSHAISRRSVVTASGAGIAALALRRHGAAQDATPVGSDEISILFVQVADGGTFVAKDDLFELTLTGVAPQTVWFSDRPERKSGMVQTVDFATDPVFDPADPPNAAIVTSTADGSDTLIVELTHPRFDAAAGTVTYDAKPVATYAGEGLADHAAMQADDQIAEALGVTSLFIDELSCKPKGSFCKDGSQCCSKACTSYAEAPPNTCVGG